MFYFDIKIKFYDFTKNHKMFENIIDPSITKIDRRPARRIKNIIKCLSCCEMCGATDIRLMEFHHIYEKNFQIADCGSVIKILEESRNTVMLCIWCHRIETKKQRELEAKHILEGYEELDPSKSKVCKGPICNGRERNSKYFQLTNICRTCVYKINANFVMEEKVKIGKCQHCDIMVTSDNHDFFDFDHLTEEYEKLYTISSLSKSNVKINVDEIRKEMRKCQLLCCKCHRIKSSIQGNYKYSLSLEDIINPNLIHNKLINMSIVYCVKCGNIMDHNFHSTAKFRCLKCCSEYYNQRINKDRRMVVRPTTEQLLKEVIDNSYVTIGKKYGVTDNTIKKWLLCGGIDPPAKYTKTKIIADLPILNKIKDFVSSIVLQVDESNKLKEILEVPKQEVISDVPERGIFRPSLEQLISELNVSTYASVSRKYQVCEKTLRNWIIGYGGEPPRKLKKANPVINKKTKPSIIKRHINEKTENILPNNKLDGDPRHISPDDEKTDKKEQPLVKNTSENNENVTVTEKIKPMIKKNIVKKKPLIITKKEITEESIETENNKINLTCKHCTNNITKESASGLCPGCSAKSRRTVTRPSLDELLNELKTSNYLAVGAKYGVSDNAIRKWIKGYNAIPPRKIKSKTQPSIKKTIVP